MVRAYAPRASVRAESIGWPPPPRHTGCSTTQVRTAGRPVGPYRTRPVTTACGARRAPARHNSNAVLRNELPEIFRIEVLEVGLQRVGIERRRARLAAGLSGLDRREREQALACENRRFEPQGDRDRIGRPGVDLDHRIAAVDVQLGIIRVVLHLGDDDLPQVCPQAEYHLLQEIMGERPRELHARELHGDGARLGGSDPDREHALPFLLLENDDRCVGRTVESQMRDPNLNLDGAQVPISHDARYFCCSGVSVSMVTPMAASFRRAISASRSRGIRCTSFVSSEACFTTCSAASAWFANDMSITLAGWPSAAARLMSRPSASTKTRFPPSRYSSTNSRTRVGPCATCFRPSRSISTLKWPELASTAPSFIARMCSTRSTCVFPVSVTKTSPTAAASAIGITR